MTTDNATEKLAKELHRTNRLLGKKQAFYRGMISGLGASIGATLILALLLWIFSQLEYIPVIGTIIKPANEVLKNNVTDKLP